MKNATAQDFFLYFMSFMVLTGLIAEFFPPKIGDMVIHYFMTSIAAVVIYGLLGIVALSAFGLIFLRK